jgi:hypothetical protein
MLSIQPPIFSSSKHPEFESIFQAARPGAEQRPALNLMAVPEVKMKFLYFCELFKEFLISWQVLSGFV